MIRPDLFTTMAWKYSISFAKEAPVTAPIPLVGDIGAAIEKAGEAGYDAMEMHLVPEELPELEAAQAKAGSGSCTVRNIVTGRLFTVQGKCLLDEDPSAAYAGFQAYINTAAKIGADIVLGWARGNIPANADRVSFMDEVFAPRLKVINDMAAAAGVRVMIEVINRYEVNMFKTGKETVDFLNRHPELGSCMVHLDTFHMNIEETDPCEAIRYCGSRMGYLHVADNTRSYPGSGTIDFRGIMKALKEIGYTGIVNVECLPVPDRETTIRKAIENLKKIEAEALNG